MFVPHQSPHGKLVLVSMMKDEAPGLVEWVAHHLAVGFTDILVFTNDCTDGTAEMLQRLATLAPVHHRPNDVPAGKKPQPSAIKLAEQEPMVREADWVMLLDADEFLSINHPGGSLDALIEDAGDAHAIVATWRVFGSSGHVEWSADPVTEQFTRAASREWNKGWGVKTLFRHDPDHWRLGIHRPKMRAKSVAAEYGAGLVWLNGSGEPMEDYFKYRGWRSIRRTVGFEWVQVNHYAVKSAESFLLRKARGNVNNKAGKYDPAYWAFQDRNEVEDRAACRHAEGRRTIMSALMQDPVLRALHEDALAATRAKLDALRQTPGHIDALAELAHASAVPVTEAAFTPPVPRSRERVAARMAKVEALMGQAG